MTRFPCRIGRCQWFRALPVSLFRKRPGPPARIKISLGKGEAAPGWGHA